MKNKLTCVSRPRRFGKSFAAKMLCAYYDRSCDSRELFEGLEVSKDVSFEKYLNQYDVIYIDIDSYIQLLRGLFKDSGRTDKMIEATYMTGILPIKKLKRKDDVLTLLIHLGYLAYDSEKGTSYIPNEEVRQEFVRAVVAGMHVEVAKLIQNSDELLRETLNRNEEAVAAAIEETHKAGATPLSYNSEESLRSVIRFAYISSVDEFLRIEELPFGHGYADMVFIPKKASSMPVILIELKWNKTDAGAIGQIKNRDYPNALRLLDFGMGFYLTSDYNQAKKWAVRTANRREEGIPIISVFCIEESELKKLALLTFRAANEEWLRYVAKNRTDKSAQDAYDVVIGPVANDQAIRTVNNYLKGYFTADIAIQLLLPQNLKDQYAFKTEKALSVLKFRKGELV